MLDDTFNLTHTKKIQKARLLPNTLHLTILAGLHLVGPDHVCDDQTTHWAIRDHLSTPSAKHEVPTRI